jgi:ketosteroid isomerase-like protein
MNDIEALLEADAQRRSAMIAADIETLDRLLSDDLIWTHSSGRTDDKAALLEGIAAGTVRYLALDVSSVHTARYGEVLISHGDLHGRASRDGVEKRLENRFLSVWRMRGDAFELLAWQSTGR